MNKVRYKPGRFKYAAGKKNVVHQAIQSPKDYSTAETPIYYSRCGY
jgi:hypothetical protein